MDEKKVSLQQWWSIAFDLVDDRLISNCIINYGCINVTGKKKSMKTSEYENNFTKTYRMVN